MTRVISSPPKRKPYTPRTVLCQQCSGKGHFSHRAYPSSGAAVSRSQCPKCAGTGRMVPSPVTHAPDCTGCGGIYQCAGCMKFCGWCYGAADDMLDHCDDCWAKAHAPPKRQRTPHPSTEGR